MALTVVHPKVNNIANWTQADLNAQIALGNFPPGTTLADITLAQDWNTPHSVTGTILTDGTTITGNGITTPLVAAGGGGSPAGTDGQVQYNNGGAFGGASQLYYDDVTNHVGIGVAAPNNMLEIRDTTQPQVRVAYDGTQFGTIGVDSAGLMTIDTSGASIIFPTQIRAASGISTSSTVTNSNFYVGSATSTVSTTTAGITIGGSASTGYRSLFRGSTNATLGANSSYASIIVATNSITEAATGNHNLISQLAIKPLTLGTGAATVTNTATLYVESSITATVTGGNYAIWVDAGDVRFDSLAGSQALTMSDANGVLMNAVAGTNYLAPLAPLTTGSVPFVDGGGLITEDNANLFYDDANNRLGIGTNTPTSRLDITTNAIGGASSNTSGISLVNNTAATSGNQQVSPVLLLTGQGFATTPGTSNRVDWRMYNSPVQGTANSTGNLTFQSSNSGGAYTTRFSLSAAGTLSSLSLVSSTNLRATAVVSAAVVGTDSGGTITAAVAGTDYQAPITLTTTGSSGAATFIGNTLNIPNYAGGGSGTVTSVDVSGGSTGLIFSGGPVTVSGTITMAGTLGGGFGGTNNAFMQFTGPATSLKTYTLPNSSATILTNAAAVTVGQGGTGLASGTSGGILGFTGTTTLASSGLLNTDTLIVGGGAGATPKTTGVTVTTNNEISGFRTTFNNQTGTTYTVVTGDTGKTITCTNAAAITVTLPNNMPVGWTCEVIQGGAGQVSFVGGGTIQNRSTHTKIAGLYGSVRLVVVNNAGGTAAVYNLAGDTGV